MDLMTKADFLTKPVTFNAGGRIAPLMSSTDGHNAWSVSSVQTGALMWSKLKIFLQVSTTPMWYQNSKFPWMVLSHKARTLPIMEESSKPIRYWSSFLKCFEKCYWFISRHIKNGCKVIKMKKIRYLGWIWLGISCFSWISHRFGADPLDRKRWEINWKLPYIHLEGSGKNTYWKHSSGLIWILLIFFWLELLEPWAIR